MISITKDFLTLPDKLSKSNRLELIVGSILFRNAHSFDKKIYRNATIDDLQTIYHNKCAYCETDTIAGAPMQVEHYRPKAKVTEDKTHAGYYWLAYEWSNLLLSCGKCNNRKRNRFPISGTRISEPLLVEGFPTSECTLANTLLFSEEGALILNPEIDVVENHFIFSPNGEIQALDRRGDVTIKTCNLNRPELVVKRLTILNEFVADVKRILNDLLNQIIDIHACRYALRLEFEKLVLLQQPAKIYSRFGYFMFHKFDLFIHDALDEKQRTAVKKLFQEFLDGSL